MLISAGDWLVIDPLFSLYFSSNRLTDRVTGFICGEPGRVLI
jgi:hypothetical protein